MKEKIPQHIKSNAVFERHNTKEEKKTVFVQNVQIEMLSWQDAYLLPLYAQKRK